VAERDLWTDSWIYSASGCKGVVERYLDVEGEWLRGSFTDTVGYKGVRAVGRE